MFQFHATHREYIQIYLYIPTEKLQIRLSSSLKSPTRSYIALKNPNPNITHQKLYPSKILWVKTTSEAPFAGLIECHAKGEGRPGNITPKRPWISWNLGSDNPPGPKNTSEQSPKNKGFDLETIWMFPKIVVPQNGWFIVENLIKMGWFGGTPIFRNTHIFPFNQVILWSSSLFGGLGHFG